MNTRFLSYVVSLATLSVHALACGSIDSPHSGTSSYRLQSSSEPCGAEPGFTGSALLERIDDAYSAPVEYMASEPRSRVVLEVDYRGGAITCFPGSTESRNEAARLEMEVELDVRTDDAIFDESIQGTISVLSDSDQVRFSGTVPLRRMTEPLPAPSHGEDHLRRSKLLLEGWMTADGVSSQGALRVINPASAGAKRHQTVASWNTTRWAKK